MNMAHHNFLWLWCVAIVAIVVTFVSDMDHCVQSKIFPQVVKILKNSSLLMPLYWSVITVILYLPNYPQNVLQIKLYYNYFMLWVEKLLMEYLLTRYFILFHSESHLNMILVLPNLLSTTERICDFWNKYSANEMTSFECIGQHWTDYDNECEM